MRKPKHNLASRRGALSLELVLILPLVATVLFSVCEFSLLFNARQTLVTASRAGARVASLSGATPADVERAVCEQLGDLHEHVVIEADLGHCSGDPSVVVLRMPMHCAAPDLLACFGFCLDDRELVAETVMCKE